MEIYLEKYNKWYNCSNLNESIKKELRQINNNLQEIKERFSADLKFGTAGLRGIMGAGTNRVNIYTIRKATQGLADFLKLTNENPKSRSVVIAYDSRNNSRMFAEETAKVLAANDIKAYLFQKITATPILSFAVRYLKCDAGIVITASHNPKEYNGYKVYGSDGGQITERIANSILTEIAKIADDFSVAAANFDIALEQNLISYVPEDLFVDYLEKVKGLVLQPEHISEWGQKLKVIYTPLHGTGNIPVCRALEAAGFSDMIVVPEQEKPDGNFSTVKYPNPEEKEALALAINLAEKEKADIVMATDPDADRVGIAVKDNKGEFIILTGNQLGVLLLDYILANKVQQNKLVGKEIMIKTIVTSEMGSAIARRYGVKTLDVLTGFKYIGEKIEEFNETEENKFVFGYEESYGYLIGDFVRDKDAVQACLLTAEMAAYYKSKGKNLYEKLFELFAEYGFYKENLMSFSFAGLEGMEKMNLLLKEIREYCPRSIGDIKVTKVIDYLECKVNNLLTNEITHTNLPAANVIKLIFEDDSWLCIRPSGTEPKLKIYTGVQATNEKLAEEKLNKLHEFTKSLL